MMQELLAIEQFCQRIFNKVKVKKLREIGAQLSYYWKVGNFVVLKAKVEEILNFASFLSLEIHLNFK
jgi:hypothetical protein